MREYLYDGFGNLERYTDRNGRVTTYEYDRLHRQTAEKWYNDVAHLNALPGAPLRTFTTVYDEASQLTSVSEGGTTYAYDYDNLGRQTQVVQTLAGLTPQVTFDRGFDARGRLIESAATIGSTADYVNVYSYDTLDRVTSIRQFGIPITGHAVNSKRVDFEYNDAGQFTAINRYASVDTSSPVVDTTFAYDDTARLTQIDHVRIVAHDYLYSDDNRLAVYNNSIDGAVHYYYDANGQLTQANYLGDWQSDETYNYDDNANRTSGIVNFEGTAAYTTGDDNRLTGDGTYAYVYDAEGNRTQRILDLDGDGAWDANEAATLYTWDHRNRLVEVEEYSPGQVYEGSTEFTYDPHDRLIGRAVDTDGDNIIDEQTFYAWELAQKVLEFDKQGTGNAAASDLSERYLWGAAVDQALAVEEVDSLTNASQNETLWTLTDNLGSVKDVVDSAGNHRIHRQFDSFGNTVSETHYDAGGSVVTAGQGGYVTIDLGYTGKMLEVYTGLQYHNARWLDLRTGSWISKDFVWDGTNRYAYVGNQPTTYVDPSGLEKVVTPVEIAHPGGPGAIDEVLDFEDWLYWTNNPHGVSRIGGDHDYSINAGYDENSLNKYNEYLLKKHEQNCPNAYTGPMFRASEQVFDSRAHRQAIEEIQQLTELAYRYKRGRGLTDEELDALDGSLHTVFDKDRSWVTRSTGAELQLYLGMAREAVDRLSQAQRWHNRKQLVEACGDVMQGMLGPTAEEVARSQAAVRRLTAPEEQRAEYLHKKLLRRIFRTLNKPQQPARK